jgi:CelD/BcsL family acetyltransferase involved in cellulose biosynthesis
MRTVAEAELAVLTPPGVGLACLAKSAGARVAEWMSSKRSDLAAAMVASQASSGQPSAVGCCGTPSGRSL